MNMQIFQCYINENVRIFSFFLEGFFFFFNGGTQYMFNEPHSLSWWKVVFSTHSCILKISETSLV